MKITTVSTTYNLALTDEQQRVLINNKKLIWLLRRAVFTSVRMNNVVIEIDHSLTFTLYAENDNSNSHNKIMQTVKDFFEGLNK